VLEPHVRTRCTTVYTTPACSLGSSRTLLGVWTAVGRWQWSRDAQQASMCVGAYLPTNRASSHSMPQLPPSTAHPTARPQNKAPHLQRRPTLRTCRFHRGRGQRAVGGAAPPHPRRPSRGSATRGSRWWHSTSPGGLGWVGYLIGDERLRLLGTAIYLSEPLLVGCTAPQHPPQ